MFDSFDVTSDSGGVDGPKDASGCFWFFTTFCIAGILFIGILKWMS